MPSSPHSELVGEVIRPGMTCRIRDDQAIEQKQPRSRLIGSGEGKIIVRQKTEKSIRCRLIFNLQRSPRRAVSAPAQSANSW